MNIQPVSFSGLHISDDKRTRDILGRIVRNEEVAKDAAKCFSAIDKNAGGEDVFLSAKDTEYDDDDDRLEDWDFDRLHDLYDVTIKDANGRELNKAVFAVAPECPCDGPSPYENHLNYLVKERAAEIVQDGFATLAKTDIPQTMPPYLRKIFDTFK